MNRCEYCGETFSDTRSFIQHTARCEEIPEDDNE